MIFVKCHFIKLCKYIKYHLIKQSFRVFFVWKMRKLLKELQNVSKFVNVVALC